MLMINYFLVEKSLTALFDKFGLESEVVARNYKNV